MQSMDLKKQILFTTLFNTKFAKNNWGLEIHLLRSGLLKIKLSPIFLIFKKE